MQTDVVRSISFEGNGGMFDFGQNDYTLASQLEQGDSPSAATFWPTKYWVAPEPYRPGVLVSDAHRLEVWYAHHGWFDARFGGWEVQRVRPRRPNKAGVVKLHGYVHPGEPSMVRSFDILGMDQPVHRQFRRTALRTSEVREGVQFNLDLVELTRSDLVALLGNHGFPYADVQSRVEAYPEEHQVDVTLTADPGSVAAFGEIEVVGNEAVGSHVILDALSFEPGDVYEARDLASSQRRVFQLGTFSVVEVTPDLSDPTAKQVPMRVRVTESKFQTLRIGGGLGVERFTTLTPRLSTNYRHTHLFHRLVQVNARAKLGYAVPVDLSQGAVTFDVGVTVSTPRLTGPKLGLAVSASVKQDVESDEYYYRNPEASVALNWKPSDTVLFRTGPEVELFDFLDDLPPSAPLALLFGSDFTDPYFLTKWVNQLVVDWRDDPVYTTRGSYMAFGVNQAVPADDWVGIGSEETRGFLYSELTADLRAYRRLRFGRAASVVPLVGAVRAQGKWLQPWGGRDTLPYKEKAFLGGANSIRGFLADQVGPYRSLCVEDRTRHLPTGGSVGVNGSAEVRYDLNDAVSTAVFGDVGMLADGTSDVGTDGLRFGFGTGVRYKSPIGPIRLDIAIRPLYAEDDGPIGDTVDMCGDQEVRPRAYDLFSAIFSQKQRDADTRSIPFALNLYLAIGEAF